MRITIFALSVVASLSAISVAADRDSVIASMPPIESESFLELMNGPALWYDETSMPKTYQHSGSAHWVGYNISAAKPVERFGNGNIEFPWGTGGGLHLSSNTQTVKFLVLPQRDGGGRWPVVYFPTNGTRSLSWMFPSGSTLCEVISIRHNGANYPFEVRSLTRDLDAWDPGHILRQFWTVTDVADAIEEVAPDRIDLANRVRRSSPVNYRIRDTLHPRSAFQGRFHGHQLPPLPQNLVLRLLDFPLREGLDTYELMSPTDSIIPANYLGVMIGSDRESCARCHSHVGKHVDSFGPLGRDWYGHVRGGDGIFSFHPFARSSISTNGFNLPVRVSEPLVRDGWIAQFDPQKHPQTIYRRISR